MIAPALASPARQTRRAFLERVALTTATLAWPAPPVCAADSPLPTRVLGRTGVRVTILGLGTAPIGEAFVERKEAERIFGEVMDAGVNYADRNIYDLEGVSAAVIGPFTLEQALQNVQLARQYRPLTEAERANLLAYGKEIAPGLDPRHGPIA